MYDYRGNLMEITVYGYIDGDRVDKSKIIRYEYNPPPAMAAPPGGGPSLAKRDDRYSARYKYKYDNKGRLIDEIFYHNNGLPGMRYVYNYKDNQREELVYHSNGSLNQKYLSVLDEKGNEIERTDFNKDGSIREKYSYKYELDTSGNWIKKTAMKWTIKDGDSRLDPTYVDYRKITYY